MTRQRTSTMTTLTMRGSFLPVPLLLSFLLLLLLLLLQDKIVSAEQQQDGYGCDYSSVDDSTPLSSLTANQFHMICPKQLSGSGAAFGQPICGDGTAFSFLFTSPTQRKANKDKILIEFMGGGACWDGQTCDKMSDMLTFPEAFNDFIGLSCSEVHYGTQNQNGMPINMLCGHPLGDVDFTSYNTIIVPYCTQDVHIGSNTVVYNDNDDDGDNNNNNNNNDGTGVNHMGAHNTMSVLRWLFRNFKNPKHIALTGCSAGGTALPVAYDLINKHYNRIGGRSVQISTITDSPVYLTPKYFLYNALDNWNPWEIIKRMGFNYQKWQYNEEYPTQVWNHVLRRGPNEDQWGFVSHTNDDVSQAYYQWMSGNGGDRQLAATDAVFFDKSRQDGFTRMSDDARHRQLEEGNNDDGNQNDWWTELSSSIDAVTSNHKNVNAFWIDGDGHCSFGLYYPLQEDGFAEWAGAIFAEQNIGRPSAAVPLFLLSVVAGGLLFVGAYAGGRKNGNKINVNDDGLLDEQGDGTHAATKKGRTLYWLSSCTRPFQSSPITSSYCLAVTIYFWTMLVVARFAHPINNPSLGPSAIWLSKFGINNPSKIVFEFQIQRLFSSNFLCSGVLTYFIFLLTIFLTVRPLEMNIKNHRHFGIILAMMMLGTNLVYALFGNGASCSASAIMLGFSSFAASMRRAQGQSVWCASFSIVFVFGLISLAFPFNSWIMLGTGIIVGIVLATTVFTVNPTHNHPADSSPPNRPPALATSTEQSVLTLERTRLLVLAGVYALLGLLVLSRIHSPDRLYLEPYFTGCDVMVAQGEDIQAVAGNFYNADRRNLQENDGGDYSNMCAQFCVPNIASRGVPFAANRFFGLPITRETCEELGYDEHMADKTFKQFSYSVDVELFVQANGDGEN